MYNTSSGRLKAYDYRTGMARAICLMPDGRVTSLQIVTDGFFTFRDMLQSTMSLKQFGSTQNLKNYLIVLSPKVKNHLACFTVVYPPPQVTGTV